VRLRWFAHLRQRTGLTGARGAAQAHVAVVLTQVLPGLATWRFAHGAERWRLAAAALRVLRLALLAPPAPAAGTSGAPCPGPGSTLPRPALVLR